MTVSKLRLDQYVTMARVPTLAAMAGAVLVTTVWVDGLFLVAALLQPGMSGLID